MEDIRISGAPLTLKDEIWQRKVETYREHRERLPFAFPRNGLALEQASFDLCFVNSKGRPIEHSSILFCAYAGDQFCGYIQLGLTARPEVKHPPVVNIGDIWVAPGFRGRGVARLMLDHVVALSRERDWDNLTAMVWAGNDSSSRLFRSAGFTPQSETVRLGPLRQASDWKIRSAKKSTFTSELAFLGAAIAVMILMAVAIGLTR